jgi:hypothetical protein
VVVLDPRPARRAWRRDLPGPHRRKIPDPGADADRGRFGPGPGRRSRAGRR